MKNYVVIIYMVFGKDLETYTEAYITKKQAYELVNKKRNHPLLAGILVSKFQTRQPNKHLLVCGKLFEEFKQFVDYYELKKMLKATKPENRKIV